MGNGKRMSYLGELRKLVGHLPLLMVGATVLVLDQDRRLLLLKRSDNQNWGPPGGAVELGELIEETARRETFEETGLKINAITLFNVFSGKEQYYCYPNGDEVHIVAIVYVCKNFYGEIRLSEEHTEWGWFALSEISEDLSPPIKPIIEQFKQSSGRLDT
jgi:ADP-ribose pyrophosphatase YjhB (NUDIX family)